MKVLVTGARGMLGNDVCQALQENLIEYVGVDLADFDLADASMAEKYIGTVNPTHIINCAAYTAVDLAESNYDDAYKGNVLTCESLAKASMVYGIKLLSISTDFVFDGKKEKGISMWRMGLVLEISLGLK